jgi:glycosyltransferase involved in cell wall biosynthesis
MKRVLIVYHYFALYRLPIVRALMQREGYEFTLISSAQSRAGIRTIDPELAELAVEEGGVRWEFLKNIWIGGKKSPFLWQQGLVSRLKQDDYDAVIFLGAIYYLSTWFAIRTAKKCDKRVIIWTHGFLGKDSSWRAALRHRLYRMADACLLYGNRARDIMLQTDYYDPEQLYVVYNSLDHALHTSMRHCSLPEAKRKQRKALYGDDTIPVVTYIGRLSPDKSLELLVDAMAISRKSGTPFKVLLIGEGPLKESLSRRAKDVGVADDLTFYGYCEDEETACKMLGCGDVCVVPGGVGLTGMHAMGVGVPVVSHGDLNVQKPECEAIVSGKTGATFKRGDAADLAKTLGVLFSDQDELAAMRENCFTMMDTFFNPNYQSEVICNVVDGVPNTSSGHVPAVLFDQSL